LLQKWKNTFSGTKEGGRSLLIRTQKKENRKETKSKRKKRESAVFLIAKPALCPSRTGVGSQKRDRNDLSGAAFWRKAVSKGGKGRKTSRGLIVPLSGKEKGG